MLAVGSWLVLVMMSVVGGNLAGLHQATDAQLAPGETGRAAAMIQAAGLQGHDTESVLITARPGAGPDRTALDDAAAQLAAALGPLPIVTNVATAIRSPDLSARLVPVTVADGIDDPKPLLSAISGVAARYPALQIDVTGSLTIQADVNDQLDRDFSSALLLSLPITIVILLLAFGALLAAGVPVLLGLTMSGRPARIWPMLLRPALRFPALTLLLGVAGMLLLAWPATSLHLKASTAADLPQTSPGVAGYELLTNAFPDQRSSITVVVTGEPAQVRTIATRLTTAVAGNPAFGAHPDIRSVAGTSVLSVSVPYTEDSDQARAALHTVRATLVPQALRGIRVSRWPLAVPSPGTSTTWMSCPPARRG